MMVRKWQDASGRVYYQPEMPNGKRLWTKTQGPWAPENVWLEDSNGLEPWTCRCRLFAEYAARKEWRVVRKGSLTEVVEDGGGGFGWS